MSKLKDKISASLVLGSYLDTLGFFNGVWEFNYDAKINSFKDAIAINYNILHNFYALGGYNINLSNMKSSDDTIMMIATANACIKGGTLKDFMNEYLNILPLLEQKTRISGITTVQSLRILDKTKDPNKIYYSSNMGGNGAAMRTHYIGIHYNDINKIIDVSIMASRLTHNYPLGFLGGMTTALFTYYAINNINPWEWASKMIKLEESGLIDSIVKKQLNSNDYKEYLKDKEEYWLSWKRYDEFRTTRFAIRIGEFFDSYERYNDLYKIIYNISIDKNDKNIPYARLGGSGNAATIIALDGLLMCLNPNKGIDDVDLDKPNNLRYNWENLIFFTTLHFGDNDTTGAISGMWYGALKGYEGVNKSESNIINMLEFKKEIKKIII
jgi:ADP-ribosylarginine hydrolase